MKTWLWPLAWALAALLALILCLWSYGQFSWLLQLSRDGLDGQQPLTAEQLAWLGWDEGQAGQYMDAASNQRRSTAQNRWLALAALGAWAMIYCGYRCVRLVLMKVSPASAQGDKQPDPGEPGAVSGGY